MLGRAGGSVAIQLHPDAFSGEQKRPTPIVGVRPFLAALVVLAVTEGKSGVMGLLRRMVRWHHVLILVKIRDPAPPHY